MFSSSCVSGRESNGYRMFRSGLVLAENQTVTECSVLAAFWPRIKRLQNIPFLPRIKRLQNVPFWPGVWLRIKSLQNVPFWPRIKRIQNVPFRPSSYQTTETNYRTFRSGRVSEVGLRDIFWLAISYFLKICCWKRRGNDKRKLAQERK